MHCSEWGAKIFTEKDLLLLNVTFCLTIPSKSTLLFTLWVLGHEMWPAKRPFSVLKMSK